MAFWEDWDCSWWWGQWLRRRRQRRRWRRRHGLSEEDIEFLKMELRSIHGALRLVGAVPSEQISPHLKHWADQSREVSYDIQDILDTFLVRVKEAHPDSSKGLVSKTRREIAESIIDVKILVHDIGLRRGADAIRAQEIAERRLRLRYLSDTLGSGASIDTSLLDVIKDENQLVGAGGAMEEIIAMLSMDTDDTSNHQLKTVSIVGFGGLGKTTLARAVYKKIQPQFHCSAFVSLSQNPNIKEALRSMLEQLDNGKHTSEATSEWDEGRLVDELRQLLQNKRYLIAVDDIWTINSWQAIRGAMVDNNFQSRIITTTRLQAVAREVGGAYKLRPLSHDDSKILFYKNIFGSEVTYDEINQLDGILVDKILKKCGGLPLAIVSVARHLESIPRRSLHEGLHSIQLEVGPTLGNMTNILLLCYYALPPHLKLCLLYTSIFPEDYGIRRDRLVWRWIAEGFIEGKEGCSLFEIGQKYLDELLNRRLISVNKDDVSDGMANYCYVHDIVRDNSCSLASDENFVTILVGGQEKHIFRHKVIRRLSLQNSLIGRRADTLDVGHVRSVAAFGTGIDMMPPLSRFHILRVLDLEGCDLRGSYYNPEHLGKLFHLRYLGLRATNVSQLPKDIGNMRFLQVLDLKETRIRELPSTVALLRRLLCLYAEPDTTIPKGMGNVTSLEELSKVSVSESPSLMEELTSFVELRVLDIVLQRDISEGSQKDFAESLCKLQKLQTLRIFAGYSESELDFMAKFWAPPPGFQRFAAVNGWFSVLPTWISDAGNLSELQMRVRELWREGVESLGGLRDLRFLCLEVQRMGERLAVHAGAFPNLTQLRLKGETFLVFRRGAMPELQVLELVLAVDKAEGDFNWGLTNLPSLQKVTVNLRTGKSASANKEAEAALRDALDSHPNHPKLTVDTAHQEDEQMVSVDDRARNVASSSEIQDERSA